MECNVCCTVLAVPELEKKQYEPCDHMLGDFNCDLFNKPERPKVCRAWYCFWLAEGQRDYKKRTKARNMILDKEDRPDKSGVVFAFDETWKGVGPGFNAYEAWPSAFETSDAQNTLQYMASHFTIFRKYADG